MTIYSSPRILFTLGFLLLAVTNMVVLTGVASNRSGEPETLIYLTERELSLPYRTYKESSGIALKLTWRTLSRNQGKSTYYNSRSPVWLNDKKLEALGFHLEKDANVRANIKDPLPKEVFIVLEYNGEQYNQVLKRAEIALIEADNALKLSSEDKKLRADFERAEERANRERISASRLFVIDAGLDPKKLRTIYIDRARFIITKGIIQPRYYYKQDQSQVYGYISRLSIDNIHVPLQHRQLLNTALTEGKSPRNKISPPRYHIELAYGHRHEPWIASVRSPVNQPM